MSRLIRLLVALAGVCAAIAAAPRAEACSVTRTYIAPTNYELIDAADAVLLARVVGEVDGAKPDDWGGPIEFEIEDVYKGAFESGASFVATGRLANPSHTHDELPLERARSGHGMCIAGDYLVGRLYVLVVHTHPETGEHRVSGPPFTRVAEVVVSGASPWARVVDRYAEIAALDDPEAEANALRALLDKAKADGDAFPEGLADDLERHFASPTYAKSFDQLEALLDAGTEPERALLALSRSEDPRALDLFRKLLESSDDDTLVAAANYFTERANPADFAVVADAWQRLLETPPLSARWAMMWAVFAAAGPNDGERMLDLFALADEEEQDRVCEHYFVFHPSAKVAAALGHVRDDPARYEVTNCLFALAAAGDEDVLEWAETTFRKGDEEQRWKALYLFARSPLEKADTFAGQIIAEGSDDDRAALVQGYNHAVHEHVEARLKQAAFTLEGDPRAWLERTLTERAERAKSQAADAVP